MIVSYFAVFISFLIFIKNGYGKLSQAPVVHTNFMTTSDEVVRFAGLSFNGNIIGFVVASEMNNGRDISITYSSILENKWITKYKAIKSPINSPCLISSIFVDDDEITVIFRSNATYFISRSTDGIEWESPKEIITKKPLPLVFSYYSGAPMHLHDSNEKMIFVCGNNEDDKRGSGNQVLIKCAFSYDKGNSWVLRTFDIIEDFEIIFASKIFFAANKMYILSIANYNEEVYFVCSEFTSDTNTCLMNLSEVSKDYEIDTIFETSGSVISLQILYNEYAYLCKLMENGQCHIINEVPVGRNYSVVINNANNIYIIIEGNSSGVDIVHFYDKQDSYVPYNASEISVRDITEEIL